MSLINQNIRSNRAILWICLPTNNPLMWIVSKILTLKNSQTPNKFTSYKKSLSYNFVYIKT